MEMRELRQQVLSIRQLLDTKGCQAALPPMHALVRTLTRARPEMLGSPGMRLFLSQADYPATCHDAVEAALQEITSMAADAPAPLATTTPKQRQTRRTATRRAFLAGSLGVIALATARMLQPQPIMDVAKGDLDLLAPTPPLGVAIAGISPAPSWLPETHVGRFPHTRISFRTRSPVRRSLIVEGRSLVPGMTINIHIDNFPLRSFEKMEIGAAFQARIHLQLPVASHRIFIEYALPAHWKPNNAPDSLLPAAYNVLRFIPV